MNKIKEQRKHERYPTDFILEIADFVKPTKKVSALVTDISEGGLCLESSQKIEVGASLTLRLQVPLMVQGGVVRKQPRGSKISYGVRFHNGRFQPQVRKFTRARTMVRMPSFGVTGTGPK